MLDYFLVSFVVTLGIVAAIGVGLVAWFIAQFLVSVLTIWAARDDTSDEP